MKVLPITVGPVRAIGVPSLDKCVSTISKNISEPSIDGFNFTTHVKVTSDPIILMKLALLLVSVIKDGVGTAHELTN